MYLKQQSGQYFLKDKGLLHPVAFFSHKLSAAERNYKVRDREHLVIKEALEEWRYLLEGAAHPILIYTYHKNLEYLKAAKRLKKKGHVKPDGRYSFPDFLSILLTGLGQRTKNLMRSPACSINRNNLHLLILSRPQEAFFCYKICCHKSNKLPWGFPLLQKTLCTALHTIDPVHFPTDPLSFPLLTPVLYPTDSLSSALLTSCPLPYWHPVLGPIGLYFTVLWPLYTVLHTIYLCTLPYTLLTLVRTQSRQPGLKLFKQISLEYQMLCLHDGQCNRREGVNNYSPDMKVLWMKVNAPLLA